MQRPTLLATGATDETFAGVTYHLDGELVPALTVELNSAQTVYFEHHILLWKEPRTQIGIKALKGGFRRCGGRRHGRGPLAGRTRASRRAALPGGPLGVLWSWGCCCDRAARRGGHGATFPEYNLRFCVLIGGCRSAS